MLATGTAMIGFDLGEQFAPSRGLAQGLGFGGIPTDDFTYGNMPLVGSGVRGSQSQTRMAGGKVINGKPMREVVLSKKNNMNNY